MKTVANRIEHADRQLRLLDAALRGFDSFWNAADLAGALQPIVAAIQEDVNGLVTVIEEIGHLPAPTEIEQRAERLLAEARAFARRERSRRRLRSVS